MVDDAIAGPKRYSPGQVINSYCGGKNFGRQKNLAFLLKASNMAQPGHAGPNAANIQVPGFE